MKYQGKEVKFIKDYGTYILVEHKEGYKEAIHKHDLGLIRERVKPPKSILNPEKVVIYRKGRIQKICD